MTLEKLSDNRQIRSYFFKFGQIVDHLKDMAGQELENGDNEGFDSLILESLQSLSKTFDALTLKYLFAGLDACWVEKPLSLDVKDSGFPYFTEILEMENDIRNASEHLSQLPDFDILRQDMVDFILKYKSTPHDIRAAMAKRAYFQNLSGGGHFLSRNTPSIQQVNLQTSSVDVKNGGAYLVTWSTYDSSRNQPVIYLMVVEETGDRPLHEDGDRLERFRQHILNQSMSTLKLLTIGQGVDQDFPTIHPKMLKRLFIGPMYSNSYTTHADRLSELLARTESQNAGWILSWTIETLVSRETGKTKSGLFGTQPKEIYHIPSDDVLAVNAGATRIDKRVIMPYEVRQSLDDEAWRILGDRIAYVVGENNRVLRL